MAAANWLPEAARASQQHPVFYPAFHHVDHSCYDLKCQVNQSSSTLSPSVGLVPRCDHAGIHARAIFSLAMKDWHIYLLKVRVKALVYTTVLLHVFKQ